MKRHIVSAVLSSALLSLAGCGVPEDLSFSARSSSGESSKSVEGSSSSAQSSKGGAESSSSPTPSSMSSQTSATAEESSIDTEGITYWCTAPEKDFFEAKAKEFKQAHPEFKGDITCLKLIDETSTWNELREDKEAAADLMCMFGPTVSLAAAEDLLTPLDEDEMAHLEDRFTENSILSSRYMGTHYGIPYRNDGGYVLFYNKAIVGDEDAKTLEGIIASCKKAGAPFYFDITNPWHTFSPVWAAGGRNYTDDQGVYHSDIATDKVAEALVGFQQIILDAGDTWKAYDWYSHIDGGFGAGIYWDNEEAFDKLIGENLGVTTLPSFTVKDKTYDLMGFQSFKNLCIRKAEALTPEKLAFAKAFRDFLTSDESAKDRLISFPRQGVPNLSVIEEESAWSERYHFSKTLVEMELAGRTVVQENAASTDNFWTPAGNIGWSLSKGEFTDVDTVLEALRNCAAEQEKQNNPMPSY